MIRPPQNASYRRPPAPPAPATPPRLALRAEEVADSLGVSVRTVMQWVAAGEVPHVRLGERNLRFPVDALRDWLAKRTSWPTGFVVSPGPEQSPVSTGIPAGNGHRAANGAAIRPGSPPTEGGEGRGVARGFLTRPGGGGLSGKISKFNRGAADE
jgi:excisionase family DNA binding protein